MQKMNEIDAQIDSLTTSEVFGRFKRDILDQLHRRGEILERLDQERLCTRKRITRIEADVLMLKQHLHIV